MAVLSNAQMVDKLKTAAASNVGVVSINIDGRIVTFNRQQLLAELAFWERRLGRESRSIFTPIRLG